MSDPSVENFIEGTATVEETANYEYGRNPNKHGVSQRCRHCGKDFETRSRKRNYMLNVHKSECPERA